MKRWLHWRGPWRWLPAAKRLRPTCRHRRRRRHARQPLTQFETKNFWFSTLRARLGYAADRVLFYGTAGGALGDVAPGQSGNFQRITKGGWAAGAGVEAAFTENLTARIEYLYLRLGNATCTSTTACGSV